MRKSIQHIRFRVNGQRTEIEEQRRLVILFLLISLALDIVGLSFDFGRAAIAVLILFAGLALVSLVFALRNSLLPGRILMPAAGFTVITYLVYQGGIHDDALGGYYLILLMAGSLMGSRGLIIFGLLNTISIVMIGLAETGGSISTTFGPLTESTTIITSALFMLSATLGLHILVARLNRAAERARHNEKEQMETNLELRLLKTVLEQRVNDRTGELDFANRQLQMQLERINSLQVKLREEAIRDSLTGLFNRRYLDETIKLEISRADRENRPIAFLLMDIDHFKKINDTHGHQAGENVLQIISRLLIDGIRGGDIACRYGGEEFLLVLPGMPKNQAVQRAEQFRTRIQSQTSQEAGQQLNTTMSMGVAVYPEDGKTQDDVIRAADEALYRAKEKGRNRVECACLKTRRRPARCSCRSIAMR